MTTDTTNDAAEKPYYTVSAIYDDNDQRYSTGSYARSVDEAAADAIYAARNDNSSPEEITICGIFLGQHECQDVYSFQADERPKYVPSRAKTMSPFTVLYGDSHTHFVNAANGRLAERMSADDGEMVSGVLAGHLENLIDQVDWAKVKVLALEEPVDA